MNARMVSLPLVVAVAAAVVSTSAPAAPARHAGPWRVLKVGQSITLVGTDTYAGGTAKIRLTLLRVVDPATSSWYRPRTGTRFVAFRLRYTNLGAGTWRTVPAANAELADSAGRTYTSVSAMYDSRMQPWPVLPPDLNHGITLHPRQTFTGYLGWVVRSKLRLAEFRYSIPDSIQAIWKLRPS